MSLPAFLDIVPVCVVRGGQLHMDFGEMALVLPIHSWYRNVGLGNEAIDEWQREKRGMVVPIKAEVGH